MQIDAAPHIVAQMGAEPFIEALKAGAEIIISGEQSLRKLIRGRAYDPAPYAAACLYEGINAATAWHMGKVRRYDASHVRSASVELYVQHLKEER
jgi:hypothetical protein